MDKNQNNAATILKDNIELLDDFSQLFNKANTLQKQEIIRRVFDNSLYYKMVYFEPNF